MCNWKCIAIRAGYLAVLILLSGCTEGKKNTESQGQVNLNSRSLKEHLDKKFGSPVTCKLAVRGDDHYHFLEVSNAKSTSQIWNLLTTSPSCYDTTPIQGMPSVALPHPPWIFEFLLPSVTGKNSVRFEVFPHEKNAWCCVDGSDYGFWDISENEESIQSFVETETRTAGFRANNWEKTKGVAPRSLAKGEDEMN